MGPTKLSTIRKQVRKSFNMTGAELLAWFNQQLEGRARGPKGADAELRTLRLLLTWNCNHLANAALRSGIEAVCRAAGFEPPLICTPEELPTEV